MFGIWKTSRSIKLRTKGVTGLHGKRGEKEFDLKTSQAELAGFRTSSVGNSVDQPSSDFPKDHSMGQAQTASPAADQIEIRSSTRELSVGCTSTLHNPKRGHWCITVFAGQQMFWKDFRVDWLGDQELQHLCIATTIVPATESNVFNKWLMRLPAQPELCFTTCCSWHGLKQFMSDDVEIIWLWCTSQRSTVRIGEIENRTFYDRKWYINHLTRPNLFSGPYHFVGNSVSETITLWIQ